MNLAALFLHDAIVSCDYLGAFVSIKQIKMLVPILHDFGTIGYHQSDMTFLPPLNLGGWTVCKMSMTVKFVVLSTPTSYPRQLAGKYGDI